MHRRIDYVRFKVVFHNEHSKDISSAAVPYRWEWRWWKS